MKKIILLLAALMSIGAINLISELSAQETLKGQPPQFCCTCLPEGITFSTQSQIDDFQTNYPSCKKIRGGVNIGEYITNLNGLSVLTSIGGYLSISYSALTSLTGLDNIAAGSITDLTIQSNSSLSTCEVTSICEYLKAPNGTVTISYNATGCNSQAQVIAACETVGIDEVIAENSFSIYPNPFAGQLSIEFNLPQTSTVSIQIFNAMGAKVAELHHGQLPAGQQRFTWHAGDLPKGMYFCRVQMGQKTTTQKIIKVQ